MRRLSSFEAMLREKVRLESFGIESNTDKTNTAFHAAPASRAAQNFNMPALSPTMTEGNISTWRVKEGTMLRTTNSSRKTES